MSSSAIIGLLFVYFLAQGHGKIFQSTFCTHLHLLRFSACSVLADLYNSAGVYITTACEMQNERNQSEARRQCSDNQMIMYQISSEERKIALFNFAYLRYARGGTATMWVHGRFHCTGIYNGPRGFEEISEYCSRRMYSYCETNREDPNFLFSHGRQNVIVGAREFCMISWKPIKCFISSLWFWKSFVKCSTPSRVEVNFWLDYRKWLTSGELKRQARWVNHFIALRLSLRL